MDGLEKGDQGEEAVNTVLDASSHLEKAIRKCPLGALKLRDLVGADGGRIKVVRENMSNYDLANRI